MAGSLRSLSKYVVPAATLAAAVVVWELASRVLRIPKFIMPTPSQIVVEAWEWRYRFIAHSWVTLYETLGGFALSIVVGVPLATLIVYSPWMRRALYPLIVLLQAVPKIAVAPVLLLVIGYGETSKVIGAVVGEFIGSDKGLGYVILSATSYWKTELAFASMILLSLIAILLFGAVCLVERFVCPWLAPAAEE